MQTLLHSFQFFRNEFNAIQWRYLVFEWYWIDSIGIIRIHNAKIMQNSLLNALQDMKQILEHSYTFSDYI